MSLQRTWPQFLHLGSSNMSVMSISALLFNFGVLDLNWNILEPNKTFSLVQDSCSRTCWPLLDPFQTLVFNNSSKFEMLWFELDCLHNFTQASTQGGLALGRLAGWVRPHRSRWLWHNLPATEFGKASSSSNWWALQHCTQAICERLWGRGRCRQIYSGCCGHRCFLVCVSHLQTLQTTLLFTVAFKKHWEYHRFFL